MNYPRQVIPDHFKGKEVYITDPEIISNADNLNYNAVDKDSFLSKEQRRQKKKKIIEIATTFFNVNCEMNPLTSDKISLTSVAKYFGIARQSFNDHVKGIHLNSAVHGHATKPFLNDSDIDLIKSMIISMHNSDFNNQMYEPVLSISDRHLKSLIELTLAKKGVTENCLKELKKEIDDRKSNSFMDVTNQEKSDLKDLQFLYNFFRNGSLVLITNKIGFNDLFKILDTCIEFKKRVSSVDGLPMRTISQRTISRTRKRIGIPASQGSVKTPLLEPSIVNTHGLQNIGHNVSMNNLQNIVVPTEPLPLIPSHPFFKSFSDTSTGISHTPLEFRQTQLNLIQKMDDIIQHKSIEGPGILTKMKEYKELTEKLYYMMRLDEPINNKMIKHSQSIADILTRLVLEMQIIRKSSLVTADSKANSSPNLELNMAKITQKRGLDEDEYVRNKRVQTDHQGDIHEL